MSRFLSQLAEKWRLVSEAEEKTTFNETVIVEKAQQQKVKPNIMIDLDLDNIDLEDF